LTLAQFPDARFQVHDPAVPEGSVPNVLTRVRSPLQALDGAAALLILTPWPEYRAIAPAAIADQLAGNDILDPYRVLDRAAVRAAGLRHHMLGVGDG
jgi:UDPglucose 6-dehydrogenase